MTVSAAPFRLSPAGKETLPARQRRHRAPDRLLYPRLFRRTHQSDMTRPPPNALAVGQPTLPPPKALAAQQTPRPVHRRACFFFDCYYYYYY